MGHHLWEKIRCQHKLSAPSSLLVITHQSSKEANFASLGLLRLSEKPHERAKRLSIRRFIAT
jgi:hypothetical protein